MTNQEAIERLRENKAQMMEGGGADRIDAQHKKGKLTARERIDLLLDKGSFIEQQPYMTIRATDFGVAKKKYMGDGVVSGTGKFAGMTGSGKFWPSKRFDNQWGKSTWEGECSPMQ